MDSGRYLPGLVLSFFLSWVSKTQPNHWINFSSSSSSGIEDPINHWTKRITKNNFSQSIFL